MLKLRNLFGGRAKPSVALPVDLTDPVFVADPAPAYAWLRENAPLAPVKSGGFLLTRHAEIKEALTSKSLGNAPSRFSTLHARNAEKYVAASLAANIPPFLDQPEHMLPRQALTRSFHNAMKDFAPVAEELAKQHVAAVSGTVDLFTTIAQPFACQTIGRFVGLAASTAQIKTATTSFFRLFAPTQSAEEFSATNAALANARALLSDALMTAPTTSLIGQLKDFQTDHPDLTDQHIIDNALLVLADGVENIEAGIAQVALHGGPLNESQVKEIISANSPAQIIPRVCRAAFELHGETIAVGTPVFLALGSANLDGKTPIPFGAGRHSCIGEKLAICMILACAEALQDAEAVVSSSDITYAPMFGHRWPRGVTATFR